VFYDIVLCIEIFCLIYPAAHSMCSQDVMQMNAGQSNSLQNLRFLCCNPPECSWSICLFSKLAYKIALALHARRLLNAISALTSPKCAPPSCYCWCRCGISRNGPVVSDRACLRSLRHQLYGSCGSFPHRLRRQRRLWLPTLTASLCCPGSLKASGSICLFSHRTEPNWEAPVLVANAFILFRKHAIRGIAANVVLSVFCRMCITLALLSLCLA